VHHLDLSQSTRVTDGQTDRSATAIPRVALHAVQSHGKNAALTSHLIK